MITVRIGMGMTVFVMGAPVPWGAVLVPPMMVDAGFSVGALSVIDHSDLASLFPVIVNRPGLRERLHRHEANMEKCEGHRRTHHFS
ncbi:MAG: hypothetical protein E6Z70_08220, partial [Cutibacterium avidum]|nr:hypothetical protein [Cutibacterium avidum]